MIKSNADLGYLKVTIPLIIPVTDKVLKQLPAYIWACENASIIKFLNLDSWDQTGEKGHRREVTKQIWLCIRHQCQSKILWPLHSQRALSLLNIGYEGLRSKISNLLDADDQGMLYCTSFKASSVYGKQVHDCRKMHCFHCRIINLYLDVNLSFKILNDVQSTTETIFKGPYRLNLNILGVCLESPRRFQNFRANRWPFPSNQDAWGSVEQN